MSSRLRILPQREEERAVPLPYERAVAMAVSAIAAKTGVKLEVLGDGYFRGTTGNGTLTVRLNRQGADTRVVVRAEAGSRRDRQLVSVAWFTALVTALIFVTRRHGPHFVTAIGVLFASVLVAGAIRDWLQTRANEGATQRELLVHGVLRAMEDAAETQGIAGGYRIAPGADAARPEEQDELEEPGEGVPGRQARLR